MMKPEMILPPATMPWGRWLVDQVDDANRKLDAFESSSVGQSGTQIATLDNLGGQIRMLQAGTTVERVVPNFSQFAPAPAVGAAPNYIYSPAITVSTPTPRGATSCRLIFNFTVTDDADTTVADRGALFMRVNNSYGRDQRTWGPGGSTLVQYVGARSGMMIDPTGSGDYTAQFCMAIANYGVSATVTFSEIKFTYIFYGEV